MNIKAMRERRAKLVADFRAIYEKAEAEKRDLTVEELAQVRAINNDIDRLKQQIDLAEEQLTREREAEAESARDRETEEARQRVPASQATAPAAAADEERTQFRQAMDAYLRGGLSQLGAEQRSLLNAYTQRNQNTLSGAAGGFLVRPDTSLYTRLVEALKWFGGVRNMGATVLTTGTGAELPIPTDNDTDNEGEIVSEEGTHTGGSPVLIGQRILKAYVYSSRVVKVSLQLLQDADYDIEGLLSRKFGIRLARVQNRHMTVGDGVNKPQGYIAAAAVGKTAANATAVTSDEILDLIHSVDQAYRSNARFTFHDNTALALRKLKAGDGVYRWEPGLQVGAPDRLFGYAVTINNNVPTMAAGAKAVSFGDHSAYHIRDVRAMRVVRLDELYAENAQVGFLAFSRHDGGLIDAGTHPIKVLQMAAE